MRLLTFFFFTISCAGAVLAQQPTEIAVSLKTSEGAYVGQVANGGLDAASKSVTPKQIFTLVDLNGGKVSDGDGVKLRFEATLWREDKENSLIHRVPAKIAKDAECVFKLRIKDKLLYLETASGKFVTVADSAVVTTSDVKKATLFDIQAAVAPDQPTSYTVALKFANGNHVGMVAGGGLDATAAEISTNQIFTMIDLNGGTLSSGDSVRFLFGQSQMREDKDAGKIHRVPIRGAIEAECNFKIIVVGANILLQTPSGRFLSRAADGKSIVTTDKRDDTSLLTAVPNPTPKAK